MNKNFKMKKGIELENIIAISMKKLAAILSISPRTGWRLLAAGKLPKPVSIGGSKRFLMSDVKLFLECDCNMNLYKSRKENKKC